jgi:hypothetical protein
MYAKIPAVLLLYTPNSCSLAAHNPERLLAPLQDRALPRQP